MNQNIPLGRILGIKVGMSWTVLLIAGFYVYILATQQFPNEAWGMSDTAYWAAGIVGALAFFASLLVHEMSHALLARRAGIEVRGITLWLLGGFAELGSEPTTPGHQFTIAAGGPVSNLALGGIFWSVHILITGSADPFVAGYGTSGLVGVVFGWLAFVNFLLGAFNLLPATPLDGGQLFSAGIWAATGNRLVARRWAAYLGIGLGGLGVVYGISTINGTGTIGGVWIILIGWWIISAAQGDLRRVGVEQTLGQATVGTVRGSVVRSGFIGTAAAGGGTSFPGCAIAIDRSRDPAPDRVLLDVVRHRRSRALHERTRKPRGRLRRTAGSGRLASGRPTTASTTFRPATAGATTIDGIGDPATDGVLLDVVRHRGSRPLHESARELRRTIWLAAASRR